MVLLVHYCTFKCNLLKSHHLCCGITYLFHHHKAECHIILLSAVIFLVHMKYQFCLFAGILYSLQKMT